MSQLCLYFDEDASERAVVRGLRARAFDVQTAFEAELLGLDDEPQLEFATKMCRAIYTFNIRDFARLHNQFLEREQNHAGIIVIPRQRYSIGEKISRLAKLLSTVQAEEMQNRLEYI